MDDILSVINAIFQEHNKSCNIKSLELDAHHVPRCQRRFMCNQLRTRLGKQYLVTFTASRFRVIPRPDLVIV